MPNSALPPDLKNKKHWDWPWPFNQIPRAWTAWKWGDPVQVAGTQPKDKPPMPIPAPGQWSLIRFPGAPGLLGKIPLGITGTLPNGFNLRLGARWDNVGNYDEFPSAAAREYKGGDTQNTGTGPKAP